MPPHCSNSTFSALPRRTRRLVSRRSRRLAGLPALALGVTLSGCSMLTPQQVELAYPPSAVAQTGVFEVSYVRPTTIAVHTFDDYRRQPHIIGEKRNGWGMHVGEVECAAPVPEWIREALTLELENADFTVTSEENAGAPPLALYGEVDLIASRRQGDTEALLQFTVKLKRGYKLLFTRTYRGVSALTREEQAELAADIGESVDPFGEALAQALAKALAPLPSDLRTALQREAGQER